MRSKACVVCMLESEASMGTGTCTEAVQDRVFICEG
jgi:hypothetical protein